MTNDLPDKNREARLLDWVRKYRRVRPATLGDRTHLYAAFLRSALARWKGPSRFSSVGHYLARPIAVRPFGLYIEVRARSDDLIYAMEDHKPSLVRWFHPRPGEFVVDVGAHLGLYSLWAAQQGAHVLAVEPNPATFPRLLKNIAQNKPLAVDARNVAAGAAIGEATLYDPGGSAGVSSLLGTWAERYGERPRQQHRVPVLPLDVILGDPPGPEVDWLLIDTEGYEEEILRGASATLSRTHRVVIEVAVGETARQCEDLLSQKGFRVVEKESQNSVNDYWMAIR